MKDLGPVTYFLGLKVYQSDKGLFLYQHRYAMDLIEMVGLKHSTPMDTTLELNVNLNQDTSDLLTDDMSYRRLVGSLAYLTITYVVNLVSQFMTQSRRLHLIVVRRIIRYILGTPARGLFFLCGNSTSFTSYSDVD